MPASENLKMLRSQRGWSQSRLAMEANVAQQTISCIERGRNEPSAEITMALAKALHVSPAEIMGYEQPKETFSYMESQLLDIFSQLNDQGKTTLIEMAESLLRNTGFRQEGSASSVI